MKINKKILLSLALCFTLSFVACNKKEEEPKQDKSKNEQSVKEETKKDEKKEEQSEKSKNKSDKKSKGNPTFAKFTAVDLDKKEYTQEILKDKSITVLNIWGTFCGPCIKEMPDLAKLSEEYKDKDVQFIGIVVDTLDQDGNYSDEMINIAKQLIEKSGVKYLNLLPSTDLMDAHLNKVQAIPQTLILDSKGNILKEIVGSRTKDEFTQIINDELVKMK